jgi:hypothetical protein
LTTKKIHKQIPPRTLFLKYVCNFSYHVTNIILSQIYFICWNSPMFVEVFFYLIFLGLSLIQYITNKISPRCDVYIYTKKTKCRNAIFVIIIFGGCSVILPMCQMRWTS